MGVPSFARVIVEKYKDTHSPVTGEKIDHFFIDFNCIVYNCYAKLDKSNFDTMRNSQIEQKIIKSVVQYLKHLIDTVNPVKSVYIAVDGAAPCAKVQQQRFRRFKTIMLGSLRKQVMKKHNEPETKSWNTSCNIAPGTKFMNKLSQAIEIKIRSGYYSQSKSLKFILSDSNVPGEGEHKYMDLIRHLEKNHNEERIVVFSPDADVIILSLASHKKNIYLLRSTAETDVTKTVYQGLEFYYLHIDNIKKVFIKELIGKDDNKYQVKRLVTDYVLLTTFAGNDFVCPIPYLKIKLDKLRTPMKIYKDLLPEQEDYLVKISPNNEYSLNHDFFLEFMIELSQTEEYKMQGIQKSIHRERKRTTLDQRSKEAEADMSPFEIEMSRIEHKPFYSHFNPLYSLYNKEFDKINYFQQTHLWKENYYQYFFNRDDQPFLNQVVVNYIESLLFVINYYFKGVPSWKWHYKYRIAPLPSDVLNYLENIEDVNSAVVFSADQPLKPLEQLLLILPPQMSHILPNAFSRLMVNKKSPIRDLYPRDFGLDVYPGQKLIYTEPLLPEIDVDRVLKEARAVESQLSKGDQQRNTNQNSPKVIQL